MSSRIRILAFGVIIMLALPAFLTKDAFGAATKKVLYDFAGQPDGATPLAALISDSSGNLYGTTSVGGTNGGGTVFKLTVSGGKWNETVLYSFAVSPNDGSTPMGSLVFDKSGNLYGTTSSGGLWGGGTVFELSPTSRSGWKETVLYNFNETFGSGDGFSPVSGVFLGSNGKIYGTTFWGGTSTNCQGRQPGCGAFFELSPSSGGKWTETALHSFGGSPDTAWPWSNLTRDAAGNFYGTSEGGGSTNCSIGCGTVFELSPAAGGGWTSKVLYGPGAFPTDGTGPAGNVVFDKAGNLYATSDGGGSVGQGAIFRLTPSSTGWAVTLLHSFIDAGDGSIPLSGLVMDTSGALYGTTRYGGGGACDVGCGTVFRMQESDGVWKETVLARLRVGINPVAGVILDSSGHLYGTASAGGTHGFGTVFEVTQ